MRMPGFTAEVTLYPSHQEYRGQTYSGSSEQAIIPQRIKLRDVHCECDAQTDICNCEGRWIHLTLGDLPFI
jgi:hypothetical protein